MQPLSDGSAVRIVGTLIGRVKIGFCISPAWPIMLRVNDWLTLADIPTETFDYRLGNRSALEWVIDQYQVSEDPRSGTRSDPNRAGDPEYIIRLIGQVVRVSMEIVEIVKNLPQQFEP